jgi:predicted glycosyltransferase
MAVAAVAHLRLKRSPKISPHRVLIYSHDTYGLGHIRRCLAIARNLRQCPADIIIITGSNLVGRFNVPDRIDFVRVPGMIKVTNEEYLPLSMKLDAGEVLEIRKKIILATASAFRPDFFVVDKAPLGLKREVQETLLWLREHHPSCRTVLGLRDIMDSSESTIEDWTSKGIYDAMRTLYDEIWIYGCKEFYDPVREYLIPEDIASKTYYTGYLHRHIPSREKISVIRNSIGMGDKEKVVLVTTGGGGDGHPAIEAFLSAFDPALGQTPNGLGAIVVTGPFIPADRFPAIARRCASLGFACFKFHPKMERLIGAADAVVSMGGYNTVCEIISQKKPLLILPRTIPREEQVIRARVLSREGYCDYLDQRDITPTSLRERILNLLGNGESYSMKMSSFPFTGLDFIRRRISAGKEYLEWEKTAAALE